MTDWLTCQSSTRHNRNNQYHKRVLNGHMLRFFMFFSVRQSRCFTDCLSVTVSLSHLAYQGPCLAKVHMLPNQKHQASHPSVDLSASPAVMPHEPAKDRKDQSWIHDLDCKHSSSRRKCQSQESQTHNGSDETPETWLLSERSIQSGMVFRSNCMCEKSALGPHFGLVRKWHEKDLAMLILSINQCWITIILER